MKGGSSCRSVRLLWVPTIVSLVVDLITAFNWNRIACKYLALMQNNRATEIRSRITLRELV
jgi:hypothetical protein